MSKFDDDKREDLQNIFSYLSIPDEDDFATFIQAIADGIEWHEHLRWGGPGSGTGDAAPILPDLGPSGTIPDKVVDNKDTWLKLLASRPYLATERLPKVWHIPAGQGDCYALTCDAPHMYAGLSTAPAQVAKVDIADLTVLQTWTGEEGEDSCQALVFDGTFLYAALGTAPARVIKISPNPMMQEDTWLGEEGQDDATCLTCDGTHLYLGLDTDPARVVKIYPVTMHTHEVWETAPGWEGCMALTFDGAFIYAGLDTDPAKVIKIDPGSMETVAVWVGDTFHQNVRALAFDGSFIYAGLYTESAQVVKIDPRDMTTADTWLGTAGQDRCQALLFDGELIHALLDTFPTKIISIDTTTMTALRTRTLPGYIPHSHAITFDGLHLCLDAPIRYAYISYYDSTNKDLKLAYKHDSGWHSETIDSEGAVGQGTSMALDAKGYPHISYIGGTNPDLKHAYEDTDGWHIETVDSEDSIGRHTSLAMDGDGYPHIAYLDDGNYNLKYAHKDAVGWHIETVDSDGMTGFHPSITLDDSGYPHISYQDRTANWVNYAYKDGSGWHIEPVGQYDYYHNSTVRTRIALASDGYPRIAYTHMHPGVKVIYAYKDESGWHTETVSQHHPPGTHAAWLGGMVLDDDDYPHISYFWRTHPLLTLFRLKYAHQNADGWHYEVVKEGAYLTAYYDNDLKLSAAGTACISFFDWRNTRMLEYAQRDTGGGWNTWVVDSNDGVGRDNSLALQTA